MTDEVEIIKPLDEARHTEQVSIASSVIPYDRDDEKAMFLGYRCTGFSVYEALHMIDRSKAWLSAARHDPQFAELEKRIPELRKEVSKSYVEIEFLRNFRLALEKDFRILRRSLELEISKDGEVVAMTPQDHSYLLRMRAQYTPQQLQILQVIVAGGGEGLNFAKWVAENQDIIQMSRTDTVTMKRSNRIASETEDDS